MKIIFAFIILSCINLIINQKPLIGGDDHDKVAFQINQLKKRLSTNSMEELKSYALKLETYSRHGKILLGGLEDYIDSMTKDSLMTYIETVCLKEKDLLSEKYFNLIVKEKQSVLMSNPPASMGGLHDYLFKQSRSTLIRWALTAEAHERQIEKQENILGGLHDYIHTLSDADIAKYIDEKAKKFKELDSDTKLNALAEKFNIDYDETKNFINLLYRKDRATLIKYALTAEAYERKMKSIPSMRGGLKDYIHSMSDKEIIEGLAEGLKFYSELASDKKFEELAKEYKINYDETQNFINLLYRQPRATLIKYALTAEAHERAVKKEQLMGGLRDYIHTKTNAEIINLITEKVQLYKELAVCKTIDELSVKYEINYDETQNFIDLLYRQPRSMLIQYALTAEYHERKINGTTKLLGGLDDYIHKLSDQEIINYISEKVKVYTELADVKKILELGTEYQIHYERDVEEKEQKGLKFLAQ